MIVNWRRPHDKAHMALSRSALDVGASVDYYDAYISKHTLSPTDAMNVYDLVALCRSWGQHLRIGRV